MAHGTWLGVHPSYVDRGHFGRRALDVAPEVLRDQITAQCLGLANVAGAHGIGVHFAKPHGALYHAANASAAIAHACIEGIRAAVGDVAIAGPPRGALADEAKALLREGFADRGVRSDGSLVPRGEAGAVVADPAIAASRARELVARGEVDTICVHGDTPNAVMIARAVRAALGPKARA
jgi:UPF0271 protein